MSFDFSRIETPFRMQPGLARLAGHAAPTPLREGSRHWREKVAVLAAFSGQALVSVPGFDPSAALAAISAEAAEAAQAGEAAADAGTQPGTAVDPAIDAIHAAVPQADRAAARLALTYEEDFAIVDGASGTVPWLAVCLPSRWAPEEKVGRSFAAIHAPVAAGERIVAAAEGLLRLVTGGDRFERFVWTLTADPRLHQHPARGATPWPAPSEAGPDEIARIASFRHERQRFIPIPGRREAVFTIRVDSEPLASAITTREAATRVHDAIASMSGGVLEYRGLVPARDRLLAWLAGRAPALPA